MCDLEPFSKIRSQLLDDIDLWLPTTFYFPNMSGLVMYVYFQLSVIHYTAEYEDHQHRGCCLKYEDTFVWRKAACKQHSYGVMVGCTGT